MEARTRRFLRVGVIGLVLFGPGLVEIIRLEVQRRQLDRRLAALTAQHEALSREDERLRTNPAYVEGLIRSTFKYAKPGELVIPLGSDSKTSRLTGGSH